MSAISKLVGLLCFAGIFAYWYFLPYQSYLALSNSGSLLGPVVAGMLIFIFTFAIGVTITVMGCIVLIVLIFD